MHSPTATWRGTLRPRRPRAASASRALVAARSTLGSPGSASSPALGWRARGFQGACRDRGVCRPLGTAAESKGTRRLAARVGRSTRITSPSGPLHDIEMRSWRAFRRRSRTMASDGVALHERVDDACRPTSTGSGFRSSGAPEPRARQTCGGDATLAQRSRQDPMNPLTPRPHIFSPRVRARVVSSKRDMCALAGWGQDVASYGVRGTSLEGRGRVIVRQLRGPALQPDRPPIGPGGLAREGGIAPPNPVTYRHTESRS